MQACTVLTPKCTQGSQHRMNSTYSVHSSYSECLLPHSHAPAGAHRAGASDATHYAHGPGHTTPSGSAALPPQVPLPQQQQQHQHKQLQLQQHLPQQQQQHQLQQQSLGGQGRPIVPPVMSASQQVALLLRQASSADNLCQMYEGWMGWI